jgi:DNA-binding MarR family transcriptional regulator
MSIFRELGVRTAKDRPKEEFLYNLGYCYVQLERHIAKVLAPYGLSPVKMNAMMIVKHAGGSKGLSQTDLSRRMIVTAGNITRLVDRLQREGFIERQSLKGDRRVKTLMITAKGSKLLDRVWPVYRKNVEEVLALAPALAGTAAGLNDLRMALGRRQEVRS